MSLGPIHMVVIGSPDIGRLEGRAASGIARLGDVGLVRVVNAVFVALDGDEILVLGAAVAEAG